MLIGAKRRHHFVDGEPGGVGFGEHAHDEAAQSAFLLAWRVCLGRCSCNEGANAALGFDDPCAFQLGVDARYSVGVDLEIDRELTNRGQLVAGPQTIEAARLRLRPILMTSLAFGGGVLPLALASGAGSVSMEPVSPAPQARKPLIT